MSATDTQSSKAKSILAVIGPGILVAATGVGAGDLATGVLGDVIALRARVLLGQPHGGGVLA